MAVASAQTGKHGSGALLLLLPVRSSFSVSMRRHCTHVLRALSSRTASQFNSSVKTLLMVSLTWQSLASSATSSATVNSSITVVRQLAAAAHDVGREVMAGREERRCPCPCTRGSEGLRDWHGDVWPEDMDGG